MNRIIKIGMDVHSTNITTAVFVEIRVYGKKPHSTERN